MDTAAAYQRRRDLSIPATPATLRDAVQCPRLFDFISPPRGI
jgi:hypothetical protein